MDLNYILLVIGLIVFGIGLYSKIIKDKLYLSVPLIATIFGILLGPEILNLMNPLTMSNYHKIVEETSRVTLAIALMSVALRIPFDYIKKYRTSILIILLLGMTLMFLSSGILTYAIAGVPFLIAMIIGGSITPTDPVVASAIVTGNLAESKIPGRLRRFISSEAGANDGLAYPFVLLPILLYQFSTETALSEWFFKIILWRVGGATLAGIIIGYISAKLLILAEDKGTIENVYFLSYTIAISLISLTVAKIIGTDGIFSVFVAGLTFGKYVKAKERSQEDNVQEAVNHFFTLPVFVLFGMVLPWGKWGEVGWLGIILCIAILLFRRLPFVYLLKKLLNL